MRSARNRVASAILATMGVFFALGAGPLPADAPPAECVTRPLIDAQLGFPLTGKVVAVLVKAGDVVKEGQELVRLDDAAQRAQIVTLQLRADSELEIQAAQADWELSKVQRQLVSDSFKQHAVTALEMDRAALESEKSRLAMELFKQRKEEAKTQLKEAQERLAQLTLRAPSDGVVDRLVLEPGEIVQEQRPVLRLVNIRALRVEAPVPTERTLSMKPGQTVWVSYGQTGVEGGQPAFTAKVDSLASVADSASNTRVVRIQFDNTDLSPAGRMVRVWTDPPPSLPRRVHSDPRDAAVPSVDEQLAHPVRPGSGSSLRQPDPSGPHSAAPED